MLFDWDLREVGGGSVCVYLQNPMQHFLTKQVWEKNQDTLQIQFVEDPNQVVF